MRELTKEQAEEYIKQSQEYFTPEITGLMNQLDELKKDNMKKKADFDEWMSGRQWLGEKAPSEGFYPRYTDFQIIAMRNAFKFGADGYPLDKKNIEGLDENTQHNVLWAYEMGALFTKRLNEKPE